MLTYEKGLDINYFIHLDDDTLEELCYSDKYLYSLCPIIYKYKIHNLYPQLPLEEAIKVTKTYQLLYKLISASYSHLKKFADKTNNIDIIKWLLIPENRVNYITENVSEKNQINPRGHQIAHKKAIQNELKNYLDLGIYPTQRSINLAIINGNNFNIEILYNYNLYPQQYAIDLSAIKGHFDSRLLYKNIIPNLEAVEEGVKNGFFQGGYLAFGLIPHQKIINQAALNDYDNVITILAEHNILPDRETIDQLNNQINVMEVLIYYNIY
jgi:hypothetical protein